MFNLKERYSEDEYNLLASLRRYVENGILFQSHNFFLDIFQGMKDYNALNDRSIIIEQNDNFKKSDFVLAFILDDLKSDHYTKDWEYLKNIFPIIESKEGKGALNLTKQFLLEYALHIAKSSKEDWLSFVNMADSISDKEEIFIKNLESILEMDKSISH